MPRRKSMWVVITDAASARIFTREPDTKALTELAHLDNPAVHSRTHDLGTERPARTMESMGTARHAIEPRTDFHRETKAAFARQIAHYVEEGASEKKFEELIVIAPPQMLGDLRADFGRRSLACLKATLDKDLTKAPMPQIAAEVEALLKPAFT